MIWVSLVLVRQMDIIELNVPTMAIPSSVKAVVYLSGEAFVSSFGVPHVQMKYLYVTLMTDNVTPLLLAAYKCTSIFNTNLLSSSITIFKRNHLSITTLLKISKLIIQLHLLEYK